MLHGNLLLKGWWIADVSFYTTELPEYMIVTAFRGLRPDVVHICGALTYTLMRAARRDAGQGPGEGPGGPRPRAGGRRDHAGAERARRHRGLPREPRPRGHGGADPRAVPAPRSAPGARGYARWWVPPVACVVLAAVQIGDQLGLVAATAPIAGVAAVRLAMLALRRRPLREYWYDAALLAAAAASYELANVSLRAIRKFGGYYSGAAPEAADRADVAGPRQPARDAPVDPAAVRRQLPGQAPAAEPLGRAALGGARPGRGGAGGRRRDVFPPPSSAGPTGCRRSSPRRRSARWSRASSAP